ncbi:MAG: recombination regulator RecX [Desulfuromonadales bacterium]|nr:recombination regulator RecX [Desulfuromonadales bacterium]
MAGDLTALDKVDSEHQRAYIRALNILGRRDHTEAELIKKLTLAKFSPSSIKNCINQLKKGKLINDYKFALNWGGYAIRSGRSYGIKLQMELKRRGVAAGIIAKAISELTEEYKEQEVLENIVSKRFASFNHATSEVKEKQRVYSYLQRRGFSISSISDFFNRNS